VVNIDAALVRLEDAHLWDSRTLTEPLGDVVAFSADTASLSWIGQLVAGHGASSGEMYGEIKALFYRYKSVGGRDYVADFLIGARSDGSNAWMTQPVIPGRSGAWTGDRRLTTACRSRWSGAGSRSAAGLARDKSCSSRSQLRWR
jgi:hypothetical protein